MYEKQSVREVEVFVSLIGSFSISITTYCYLLAT